MIQQVELVLDAQAILGEGSSWHAGEQKLYWVDIIGKTLHCYDPATGTDQTWILPEQLGCVAPRKSGGLILYLESGFVFFDQEEGTHEVMCTPEPGKDDTLPNDGKCDPAGRFWAGTKDVRLETPIASLYRLDSDLKLRIMEPSVTISNGITWSPDFTVMYYIDTPTRQIVAYDYDVETGDISGKRVVVEIPEAMGWPDGMTADLEGMLWVAHWYGWKVARWNPKTGKLIAAYDLPVRCPTSCCFGGPDLSDLYITTARAGSPEEEYQQQPYAGGLFRLQTDVQGLETFYFAG
jgi:sugar lactone lactonase YvrE